MSKKELKILPIGGCGEIGKNMTLLEYGDEIIVIDAGIMFPQNDMLGIDYIIPDMNYLEDKWHKIVGVLLTHGHEDHVGAIGHLMRETDAPVFATKLTAGLIEGKLREAKLLEKVTIREIRAGDALKVGQFLVEPFHVTHSIPDCVGFGITTPVGLVVHTGDYKFDYTPFMGAPPDFAKIAEFSARGVLCLLADSTNSNVPGWTATERTITKPFDELFANSPGRIIVATFASLISRIQMVADLAKKNGRKLAITGRSMRENTKMARRLGYLDIDEDLIIDIEQANSLPPSKVAIMATGSQGEPTAVLGRLAYGRHRSLNVRRGDTVVISAHTIPGNEEMLYRIVNRLFQYGANVLYDENAQIHVSGHAAQEEMKLMLNLVKPRFFVPVHGELRHLNQHAHLAEMLGIPRDNIAVVENGTPLRLTENGIKVGDRLSGGYIFVDGTAVGDIGWSVLRDRDSLSQSGFFVVSLKVNGRNQMIGKPEILSRGFANLKDKPELIDGVVSQLERTVDQFGQDRQKLPTRIKDAVSRYLYNETGRRPMVYAIIN